MPRRYILLADWKLMAHASVATTVQGQELTQLYLSFMNTPAFSCWQAAVQTCGGGLPGKAIVSGPSCNQEHVLRHLAATGVHTARRRRPADSNCINGDGRRCTYTAVLRTKLSCHLRIRPNDDISSDLSFSFTNDISIIIDTCTEVPRDEARLNLGSAGVFCDSLSSNIFVAGQEPELSSVLF